MNFFRTSSRKSSRDSRLFFSEMLDKLILIFLFSLIPPKITPSSKKNFPESISKCFSGESPRNQVLLFQECLQKFHQNSFSFSSDIISGIYSKKTFRSFSRDAPRHSFKYFFENSVKIFSIFFARFFSRNFFLAFRNSPLVSKIHLVFQEFNDTYWPLLAFYYICWYV